MIITRREILRPRDLWWEKRGIFNPAAVEINGQISLLYRSLGLDHISRFGLAVSNDGENFEQLDDPVFEGDENNPYERLGVEDPRATKVGKDIYIIYTGASVYPALHRGSFAPSLNTPETPWRIRLSALRTRDMRRFERLGIWLKDIDTKDGTLFNRQIQRRYWLLHRIHPSIYLSSTTHFGKWDGGFQLMEPKEKWESMKIGCACPPIEIKEGWLMIYHGVDEKKVYRMGAALLEKENPAIVLRRTKEPFFAPETNWEKRGYVDNVVFVTGYILKGQQLLLYYGAADYSIGLAKVDLREILGHME